MINPRCGRITTFIRAKKLIKMSSLLETACYPIDNRVVLFEVLELYCEDFGVTGRQNLKEIWFVINHAAEEIFSHK